MYKLIKGNVEREVDNSASLSFFQSQGYKLIEALRVEDSTKTEFEGNENTEDKEIELIENENVDFEESFNVTTEEEIIEAEIEPEKPKKRGRKKGE